MTDTATAHGQQHRISRGTAHDTNVRFHNNNNIVLKSASDLLHIHDIPKTQEEALNLYRDTFRSRREAKAREYSHIPFHWNKPETAPSCNAGEDDSNDDTSVKAQASFYLGHGSETMPLSHGATEKLREGAPHAVSFADDVIDRNADKESVFVGSQAQVKRKGRRRRKGALSKRIPNKPANGVGSASSSSALSTRQKEGGVVDRATEERQQYQQLLDDMNHQFTEKRTTSSRTAAHLADVATKPRFSPDTVKKSGQKNKHVAFPSSSGLKSQDFVVQNRKGVATAASTAESQARRTNYFGYKVSPQKKLAHCACEGRCWNSGGDLDEELLDANQEKAHKPPFANYGMNNAQIGFWKNKQTHNIKASKDVAAHALKFGVERGFLSKLPLKARREWEKGLHRHHFDHALYDSESNRSPQKGAATSASVAHVAKGHRRAASKVRSELERRPHQHASVYDFGEKGVSHHTQQASRAAARKLSFQAQGSKQGSKHAKGHHHHHGYHHHCHSLEGDEQEGPIYVMPPRAAKGSGCRHDHCQFKASETHSDDDVVEADPALPEDESDYACGEGADEAFLRSHSSKRGLSSHTSASSSRKERHHQPRSRFVRGTAREAECSDSDFSSSDDDDDDDDGESSLEEQALAVNVSVDEGTQTDEHDIPPQESMTTKPLSSSLRQPSSRKTVPSLNIPKQAHNKPKKKMHSGAASRKDMQRSADQEQDENIWSSEYRSSFQEWNPRRDKSPRYGKPSVMSAHKPQPAHLHGLPGQQWARVLRKRDIEDSFRVHYGSGV